MFAMIAPKTKWDNPDWASLVLIKRCKFELVLFQSISTLFMLSICILHGYVLRLALQYPHLLFDLTSYTEGSPPFCTARPRCESWPPKGNFCLGARTLGQWPPWPAMQLAFATPGNLLSVPIRHCNIYIISLYSFTSSHAPKPWVKGPASCDQLSGVLLGCPAKVKMKVTWEFIKVVVVDYGSNMGKVGDDIPGPLASSKASGGGHE